LRQIGIQPDILICRTEHSISDAERSKIALFCTLESRNVIEEKDAEFSIYEIPLVLQEHGLDQRVVDFLWRDSEYRRSVELTAWHDILDRIRHPQHEVPIAVVGKYTIHKDAYKSIHEALDHAGIKNRTKVHVLGICCDQFDVERLGRLLRRALNVGGVLVLGDCGESSIAAVQYARERNVPFFGIGLGIPFFFSHKGTKDTKEENKPVCPSCLCAKQNEFTRGTQPVHLAAESKTFVCYGKQNISERHRFRYEFNNDFRALLQNAGFSITGTSPDGRLVEVIELPDHPWFVAVQFHPEFKSQPTCPHPLFDGFVSAAVKN
jgi:CTP synthase